MADLVVTTKTTAQGSEAWLLIHVRRADGETFDTKIQLSKLKILRRSSREIDHLVTMLIGDDRDNDAARR